MAKYKKRSDGRYATTVTVTINGEKKKKYICGKTIKDVDKKVAELKAQDINGTLADDNNLTIAEWAQMWLDLYKRGKVAQNTYAGYSYCVKCHIIPIIGNKRLQAIKRSDLQGVLNKLVDSESYATAQKTKVTIGQIIKSALQDGYINRDISAGLSLPPRQKSTKRVLSDAEITKIKQSKLDNKQRAFIDLLLYSGLRRGEALALTADDIVDGKIKVSKNLIFSSNQSSIKNSPKTAAGRRSVPVPEFVLAELPKSGILFPSASGAYMPPGTFRSFWERTRKQIGLSKDVTPHIFRHTYATKLFYAGVDVKTAQYLLGHSSITVTLGIYTHLQQESLNNAIDKINNLYQVGEKLAGESAK